MFSKILYILVTCLSHTLFVKGEILKREISFPFFEDEFQYPDSLLPIDVPKFNGSLNIKNTKVTGFNKFEIKSEYDTMSNQFKFIFTTDKKLPLGISGDYEFSGSGSTPSGLNLQIQGNGAQSNSVQNFKMELQATFSKSAKNFLQISNIKNSISFDSIHLYLENLSINGLKLEWIWKPLNKFLNDSFSELFSEAHDNLSELLSTHLNKLFEDNQITVQQAMEAFK